MKELIIILFCWSLYKENRNCKNTKILNNHKNVLSWKLIKFRKASLWLKVARSLSCSREPNPPFIKIQTLYHWFKVSIKVVVFVIDLHNERALLVALTYQPNKVKKAPLGALFIKTIWKGIVWLKNILSEKLLQMKKEIWKTNILVFKNDLMVF